MNLIHGFIQANKFYDDVNFPHGFNRSGKFSIQESQLLTEVGKRLRDLEQGKVMPENEVEQNFVSMCKSGTKAETKIEKLWLKYKDAIQVKSFHTVNGSSNAKGEEATVELTATDIDGEL